MELGNVSRAQRAGCDLFRKALNARLRNLCLIVGTGNLLVFLKESVSWSKQCFKNSLSGICRTSLLKDWLRPGSRNFTWESVRNEEFQPLSPPWLTAPIPSEQQEPQGDLFAHYTQRSQCRIDGRGTFDLTPVGGQGQSVVNRDGSRVETARLKRVVTVTQSFQAGWWWHSPDSLILPID